MILFPRNTFEGLTILGAVSLFSFTDFTYTATNILIGSYIFWIWRTRHERGYLFLKPTEIDIKINLSPSSGRCVENKVTRTLQDFGLEPVFLHKEIKGPVITRHLIRTQKGVQIKKMPEKDIARDLGVKSIVFSSNAGKSLISVDVPNKQRELVVFDDLLKTQEWLDAHKNMKLPMITGVNVVGKPFIFDLAKMPQLIVAGTTGSGKSVYVNSMLLSLIHSGKPFKLIISDGKGEDFFPFYRQSKNLLQNETAKGLAVEVEDMIDQVEWLKTEMDNRFSGSSSKTIPIVYMCDEFADITMQDKDGDIENSLTRIAQKGRSANIHCIICTQTPNSDVLSKTLRANIPSRIALTTGKGKESEIILDQWGAEKLLGNGDALVKIIGSGQVERMHGALITKAHLKALVK